MSYLYVLSSMSLWKRAAMTKLEEIERALNAEIKWQSLTATETNRLVNVPELARAALEAMKNPSNAQLEKISEAFRLAWWNADNNSRRDAYNAMIQAALDEK